MKKKDKINDEGGYIPIVTGNDPIVEGGFDPIVSGNNPIVETEIPHMSVQEFDDIVLDIYEKNKKDAIIKVTEEMINPVPQMSKEEFEAELQKHMKEAAASVGVTKHTYDVPIWESPVWEQLLGAVQAFKNNGYKITYWAPSEIIPQLDEIAVRLVENETESVVIITGDVNLCPLPALNCHHYHLITLLPEFNVKYVEL
jgi:deoxyhypusine synthase